jgi:hypothetical protein
MKRLTTAACLCAAGLMSFAASATAGDHQPNQHQVAAKICVAEKHADAAAFEATYGPKHAMRNCMRAHRDEAAATLDNASQQCRAEQEADPAGFAATYGTNGNDKNAFGKCVSQKAQASADADGDEFANAAQECRAERQSDPDAFAATYGSNHNGRNAFGKCVSQRVHEDETAPPTV